MTATDLTPDLDQLDEADQLDADDGALFADDGPRAQVRRVSLLDHAAAVIYQARRLTVGDLLECGAGMCSAVEDLAAALATGDEGQIKGAALDLVDVTHATAGHRAAVDARPATRRAFDDAHEMYPRDEVMTVAPRYSHADRRGATIGGIELMACHLAELADDAPVAAAQ